MKIIRSESTTEEKLLSQEIRRQDHPIEVEVQGYRIHIENPKGDVRSGVDKDGKSWSTEMKNHYGELLGTKGYDNDAIDVFIGPNPNNGLIFVVDQIKPNGDFDESKVMLGFDSAEQAKDAYLSNYDKDWKGFGNITPSGPNFKEWLYDGVKQRLPFSEYKSTPNPIQLNSDVDKNDKEKIESDFIRGTKKQFEDIYNKIKGKTVNLGVHGSGFVVGMEVRSDGYTEACIRPKGKSSILTAGIVSVLNDKIEDLFSGGSTGLNIDEKAIQ